MSRFLRFAAVGGIGFLVDALVLVALVAWTPLGPLSARIISIGVALAATWLLNRSLTFGPSARPLAVEGTRYGGVGLASAAVSYAVYSALILLLPALPPVAALALASGTAMGLSFLGYSRLVYDR